MRLHLPSLRALAVLAVDTAARVCEHALNRLDARVCRASNDLSGDADE